MLALHGFSGVKEDFQFLKSFSHQKFNYQAIDLIGHGKGNAPESLERYQTEKQIEQLSLFIHTHLQPPINLLGYSMGGRLALQYALRHPEDIKALLLIGASPGIEEESLREERRLQDEQLAQTIETRGLEAFYHYWQTTPLIRTQRDHISKEQYEILQRNRLHNSPRGLANSLRGFGQGTMPSMWSRLHEIHMPVYLITGEEDKTYTSIAKKMISLMSSAQLVTIRRAGHAAHLENSPAFLDFLKTFISPTFASKFFSL